MAAKIVAEKVLIINYQKFLTENARKVREVSSAETCFIEGLIFSMQKCAVKCGAGAAYRNRLKCKASKETPFWHYVGRTSVIGGASSFASAGLVGIYTYITKLEDDKQRREAHELQVLKIEQLKSDFKIFRDDFMKYLEERKEKDAQIQDKKWKFFW